MRTTCTCKPVKAGEPFRPDWNGCDCHTESRYVCERTGCTDYRPIRDWDPSLMRGVSSFPRCVCGARAQDHN